MEEELCLGEIKEQQFELESEEEEEEEYEKLDQMKSPVAVNWIDGGLLKGVMIINDDAIMRYKLKFNKSNNSDVIDGQKESLLHNDKKRKRDDDSHLTYCQVFDVSKSNNNDDEKESLLHNKKKRKRDNDNHHTCCQVFDVCPICYEPWTNYGRHQLCSLPCGHIYGRSCINKWLLQAKSSSMKCPQCNNLCTLEDVRPLQASRLSIAEQKKSSSSSTTTTRHFPFTKKGYEALKKYISRRTYVASRLACVTANQRLHVVRRAQDANRRLGFIRKRRDELLKCQIGAEGPQADLFLQRADALDLRILPLTRRADELLQQVYALGLQYHASRRLNGAYEACIDYFEQMCKRLDMDDVLIID
ncbi:zinc finger, RING/FYVE/PHD-type containing protein [Tanacetum coccineum]